MDTIKMIEVWNEGVGQGKQCCKWGWIRTLLAIRQLPSFPGR